MNYAYLLLGSNEGERVEWLQKATKLLHEQCGETIKTSSIYETAAWGMTDQADFLNMVVLLKTELPALSLLGKIHDIETSLGRQRDVKWGPRTLDIDILFFNGDIIELPELTIPHPFLHERRFTLVPLAEIAAEYVHPRLHKTIRELLAECPDKLEVKKFER
jgi:2-amino-4-hydroxy-6-hydroxymethyldihydropteridine diphosphokinase